MLESHKTQDACFPTFSEFIPVVGKRAVCFSSGFLGMKVLIVHFGCESLEGGEERALPSGVWGLEVVFA